MTKAKAKTQPAAQPTPAAPAVGMAPNGSAITGDEPKKDDAPDAAPDAGQPSAPEPEHPLADKIRQCRDGLKSFPSLIEGYVCAKGVYYVKELAEKALAEGEELIIVTLEKK